MSGQTATERLRALLDERDVEHEDYAYHVGENDELCVVTRIHGVASGQVKARFMSTRFPGLIDVSAQLTPEQAVEATLGPGTCEALGFDDGMDEGIDGEWVTYAPPTWHLGCGHTCEGTERPSFCPVCGRRVVEPTWEGDE